MFRVLVLDGYDETRETSARELRDAGYDVIAAAEEEEAVRAFDGEHVDVVLLDLPTEEAEEAAAVLRKSARGKALVVFAIVDPSHSRRRRDEGHARGVDYFLLRPCPPKEIIKHLRRLRR